jgi:hypothetical protein
MVCFWPVETGAVVVIGAAVVDADICVVAATVGDAVDAGVAAGVFDPLSVQPATAIKAMSNAARLRVMSKYELLFPFMVFTQIINRRRYTLFRQII